MTQPVLAASQSRILGLTVFMRGLTVEAEIGLYEHEQGRTQPLRVEIEAYLIPGAVHGLKDTVNYELFANTARKLAGDGHIGLVETYVQRLADACLEHPLIQTVRVRVEKPEALPGAVAGVELTATKA